jgi:predicted Zn-dependent protease
MHRALLIPFIIAAALGLSQCTTNPATGESQFTAFMSPEKERQVGAAEHPNILAEYGGAYDDPEITAYVNEIGQRLAAHAELPAEQFTFTVLNDPLVNAFALPGGYVYITRGLMAYANSEAELAGVIGHEIGHVTARHTAERYSRANAAGIGSQILGVLLGSSEVAQLAQQGSQLYLLKFSRGQELEADRLGIRYISRIGLDPFAQADFLDTLRRHSDLQAKMAGQEPSGSSFLQTHPNSAKRVTEAIEEAEGGQAQPYQLPRYPERYLEKIDGLLYGEDPAQGLVRGQKVLHPGMGFVFEAPEGYKIANSPQAVVIQAGQNSGVIFDAASAPAGTSLSEYITQTWAKDVTVSNLRQFTLNGMPAASGSTVVNSQNGQVETHFVAVRMEGEHVFRFQLISPAPASDALRNGFGQLVNSFHKITDAERAEAKPYRVKLMTVKAGQTLNSFAQLMPFADTYNVERLMVMNGLQSANDLKAGQKLKVIVAE